MKNTVRGEMTIEQFRGERIIENTARAGILSTGIVYILYEITK